MSTTMSLSSSVPVILPPIVPTLGRPHLAVLRSATWVVLTVIQVYVFIDSHTMKLMMIKMVVTMAVMRTTATFSH